MHSIIISVGNKMPPWCKLACDDYIKRLQHFLKCALLEIPVSNPLDEGRKILQKINNGDTVISLEVLGQAWSTPELSQKLSRWKMEGNNLVFIIGGPDGLSPLCIERATHHWSLSALTLPHALARVIVCEQLYRAGSILANHPYHRE
jgi:23S rRNA (pseudouridine1915-N3)-methyltransferase